MAKKEKRASFKLPFQGKINAGCYIDFEGFGRNEYQKFPPPVLVGILRDGHFQQVVFTKAYRWAAEDSDPAYDVIYQPDRTSFLKQLASSCTGSKPFFAYSEHERSIIEHNVGHSIAKRYRDVRGIAKKWFNKNPNFGSKPNSNELHEVVAALKLEMPEKLPKGGVTERLRKVSEFSTSRKAWSKAPAGVKQAWLDVLDHNRADVMVLKEILNLLRKMKEQERGR